MTPYEAVREEFDFPFELYPFQVERVNYLADYTRGGFYWQAGAGKTAGLTHWCLYQMLMLGVRHWILPMPPILLLQWHRYLTSVIHKRTGKPLSATVYAGTEAARYSTYEGTHKNRLKKMNLDVDFILCSYGILKNDFQRLFNHYEGRKMGVACDEAHAIKNIESLTHGAVKSMAEDRPFMALTGTPLTTPMDAYAYIKLIAPGVYRNIRQFEMVHVVERDEYEKVTEWGNLDVLAANMKIQTTRVLRREVMDQLPPIIFTPINYELDSAHLALYNRIAQEKLVEFDDGREINAISAQALRSALQQIIINWAHFEQDETKEPKALDLVDEVFGELEKDEKLVVVANFRASNKYLLEKLQKYNAVAVYGDVSPAGKQKAIQTFITDPKCRCILLQPQSAGFGVDGLQHVCSEMLILEAPTTAPTFHQVVARLDREGQKSPVNVRIGIASKTVQVRMFKTLMENDAMINSVQGGFQDLRDSIYGN